MVIFMIKWGVLGTARVAKYGVIPGILKAFNCELYGIAGRDQQKVKQYQEQFGFTKSFVGYSALLADPDVQAVYIPLPNNLHYEWVMKAIKAGKHVLCEKPLALTAKQVEELHEAAKENNVILMEAFAYLHSPYIASLKKDVESGAIGDIQYIESAFLTQGYEKDIRLNKKNGGGCTYDLGCYCTSMILSLINSDWKYVKGASEFNEDGVDIFTSVIMQFENETRASFNVGMMLGKEKDSRIDRLYIQGSKGYIKSEVEYNQSGELSYTICIDGREIQRTVIARQNYCLEIEQMGKCIEKDEKPLVSAEFSIKNAKLIDDILKAIEY